jgi:hypothetical protein
VVLSVVFVEMDESAPQPEVARLASAVRMIPATRVVRRLASMIRIRRACCRLNAANMWRAGYKSVTNRSRTAPGRHVSCHSAAGAESVICGIAGVQFSPRILGAKSRANCFTGGCVRAQCLMPSTLARRKGRTGRPAGTLLIPSARSTLSYLPATKPARFGALEMQPC